MRKSTLLLVISIIMGCSAAYPQSKAEQIDALVSKFHNYNQFTGSVLVAENGKVIYKKGFGLANSKTNTPNAPDTRHRIGSITKQFTAMLIMQLVAEGKLKLEAPVSVYLPSYPIVKGSQITIHHLLTHSSGIPNYTSFDYYSDIMGNAMTPAEIVRLFADSTLDFTPGEHFSYSNSGYVLLGHIIENVTGNTYEDELQRRILDPLKMTNTGYEHASDAAANKSYGYNQLGTVYEDARSIHMSVPYAAGALYSSVEDIQVWNEALYSDKLLPEEYMDTYLAPHIPFASHHYGYGWEIGTWPVGNSVETVNTVGHSGGINGYVTQNIRIPAERSSIILLSNSANSSLEDLARAIIGILYDKPYDHPKQSVAYHVYDAMINLGLELGASAYTKSFKAPAFYLNESEMNTVGYRLLQAGKLTEAEAVFKWNVDAFPLAWNVYDSYGEVLLALGDTAQSIINYKKSVELNPGNEYGIKALRLMGVDPDVFVVRVPVEHLQLLAGEYISKNATTGKEWKITFSVENGNLTGNDKGYKYNLVPKSENEFVNPDDGAVLKFDTSDTSGITLELFGFIFKKI